MWNGKDMEKLGGLQKHNGLIFQRCTPERWKGIIEVVTWAITRSKKMQLRQRKCRLSISMIVRCIRVWNSTLREVAQTSLLKIFLNYIE